MEKKSIFDRVFDALEKHILKILIILAIVALVTPLIIFAAYALISIPIPNPISADSILGYCGAIIGAIASIAVAFIALYESKKRKELEDEDAKEKRRDEICPQLHIHLEKQDDYFILTIENNSPHIARHICTYDALLCTTLTGDSKRELKVSFDEQDAHEVKTIPRYYISKFEKGYPTSMYISAYDIDRNLICFDYELTEDFDYYVETHYYTVTV